MVSLAARIKKNRSTGDVVFLTLNYLFLTLMFVIVAYPLVYITSASFSDHRAVVSGKVWLWPVQPTLKAYIAIFNSPKIPRGFANAIFYTFFGTLVNLAMTVLGAYPLSRRDFYGRNVITGYFVFTMLFSGGLIPLYLLVRSLGMIDSRLAMIIPPAMSVWYVIIARTYFQANLPVELHESANLDGCSDFRFILKIVLPLSKPILAVMVLYYAVGHWNSYFNALIFLKSDKLFPLQIVLRNILILNQKDPLMTQDVELLVLRQGLAELLKYAIIVFASVPMLLLYPFVQKYFIKGIMIGALKG